jgi:hypothetical protein
MSIRLELSLMMIKVNMGRLKCWEFCLGYSGYALCGCAIYWISGLRSRTLEVWASEVHGANAWLASHILTWSHQFLPRIGITHNMHVMFTTSPPTLG